MNLYFDDLLTTLKNLLKRSAFSEEEANSVEETLQNISRQMESSEKRIRTLVEAIPLGILIASEKGVVEAANPSSLSLFDCGYKQLVGKNVRNLFLIDGRSIDVPDIANLQEVLMPHEVVACKADGRQFPADLIWRRFSALAASKLLIVVEDVSARHEVERMKEEFVSMISHDLRSPLTSIKAFLGMVQAGVYDGNVEKLKQTAGGIETDTSRLLSMINNLLDMHKAEAGRLEMFIEIVPLVEITQTSIRNLEALASEKELSIVADSIEPKLHVRTDVNYTVQVLINLLSNAIKFSPRGQQIHISVESGGTEAKITVTDRGPGIKPEFREKMFNRFEQASLNDARLRGGTGLGLAISKRIVQQLGGEIGVDSEEGKGSAFWFTLPQVEL